ncbi:MAG: glycosyltransferase family 2 protein [Candidatus Coatesbacteria bacterium]|nr:glycosyltransferase family 2 protein [Candidatus Coatesbacteria bacterium]
MTESQPLVSAAVVNFNGMSHLDTCLKSLVAQTYPNLEILVSDDSSTDESVEFIRSKFPSVKVVQNPRNMGFVATANRAMQSGSADWVLLLNNDVECEPDFVERLMASAMANPDVGMFAPKMRLFYARTVLNGVGNEMCKSCYGVDRGQGEKDEGQYDEPCEVFGACGGAMLAKKEVLEQVRYMDKAIYFLFDDIDLSWRARILGTRILSVPDAVIYHKFGGFYGKVSTFKYFLSSKNRMRSFLKNYELKTILGLLPEMLKEDFHQIRGMYKLKIPSRSGITKAIVKSYLWNVLHLPGTLIERRRVQKSRVVSDEALKKFIFQGPGRMPVVLPSYDAVDLDLFRKKNVQSDRIVMGLSDEDSLGPGWDSALNDNGEAAHHRTCTKRSYFYLRLLSDSKRWLNIRARGVPIAISGNLTINGQFVGGFDVPVGEGRMLSFEIPQSLKEQDVLECILELDKTWRPIDYFPGFDNRPLGINIYEISLDEVPTRLADRGIAYAIGPPAFGEIKKVLVLRSARPNFCIVALRGIKRELPSAEISLLLQQGAEKGPYESLVSRIIDYPGQALSTKVAGKEILNRLASEGFDLCVVIYGQMPRSSYKRVEQLAKATGAHHLIGIPPEGKPFILAG